MSNFHQFQQSLNRPFFPPAAETEAAATAAPEKLIKCHPDTDSPTPGCVPLASASTTDLYRTLRFIPENRCGCFMCTTVSELVISMAWCTCMNLIWSFPLDVIAAQCNQRQTGNMWRNRACLVEMFSSSTNSTARTTHSHRRRTAPSEAKNSHHLNQTCH